MEYILETENLVKQYKDFKALSSCSIHVKKGSIYGLIGKNGAGKTTLIRVICNLQKPTSGTYSLFGIRNTDTEIRQAATRIGAIIEAPSIYQNMSAKENLIQQFLLIGLPDLSGVDELLDLVGLKNTGKKKVRNFSLGMKQRLGIAIALAGNPDLLILDEPINGLDPQGIIEIRELICELNKKRDITILISSHYLDELSKIATHYGFMDNGQIIKEISSEELSRKMQQKIELKVKDSKDFISYLEEKQFSYEIFDANTICIYEKIPLLNLIQELSALNLTVEEIHEKEESLENYYMNLIGGAHHD